MGSKSKSSTSTQTNNTNTEFNVSQADYSTGDGQRLNTTTSGDGNNVTINTTDFGAVAGGLGLAKDSLDGALAFGGDSLKKAFDFAQSGLSEISKNTNAAMQGVQSLAAANQKGSQDTLDKVLSIQEQKLTDGAATLQKTLLWGGALVAAVLLGMAYIKGAK